MIPPKPLNDGGGEVGKLNQLKYLLTGHQIRKNYTIKEEGRVILFMQMRIRRDI